MKLISVLCLILLSACKNVPIENNDADLLNRKDKRDRSVGKLFGDDTLQINTVEKSKPNDSGIIGVNVYLWRASLESIAFMPLQSADPFGGVILTDWYTSHKNSEERIKVNIRILDNQLKVAALKISIFREKKEKGVWVEQTVSPTTARKLEDAILLRAREMKVEAGS